MIRQVNQSELRPGMYVHRLEAAWMDHPFFRNRFKINDFSDIEKICKSGIKIIYIDTDKGLDIESSILHRDPLLSAEPAVDSTRESVYTPVSVAEEQVKARLVKQEAGRVISGIMADIRLGRQVDAERVSPVVEEMLGSIFRNQDALLGLTRIRQMDRYTFEHSVSVSVLLIAFAKKLGFDESTIWEVGIGGLLHDIGKLQVPDEILNKPGRLTDEEFSIMRDHVGFGSRLLGGAEAIPGRALQIVRQHHERLDGSGYPGNLLAEEISQYGKMAAIADVYDAITSDRVYHKGKPPNIVLRQLVGWSEERLFDAELVQRFVQCVGIYPVGTVVALESGRLAVVVASPQKTLLTPVVKVIYDLRKACFVNPALLDLAARDSDSGERIVKAVSPEDYGIRIASFLD